MPNWLAQASSPYLRQHADNPVDWQEWSPEAWQQAVSQNKPVFLSVGYSSCHWCHVMAHESFEDPEIAAVLNQHFVNIKLDREERPDIDEIYMTAVQLATGHGGWPMSVFLTPDKKPFFAGTYFPRHARENTPGFLTILTSLADAWQEEQEEIQAKADEFASALAQVLERDIPPVTRRIDVGLLDQSMQQLHSTFDYEEGGFGERPKFPPHALLRFLPELAHNRHRLPGDPAVKENVVNDATHMTLLTLERMAAGGIHDHVGGGFHRYATDEVWLLPHFEKMLYDNAQLLSAYSLAAKLVEDKSLSARLNQVADQITAWLEREMTSPEGAFYSALDADSQNTEGHQEEGAYYVWSENELRQILGEEADEIIRAYNVRPEGNFRDEATGALTQTNILHSDDFLSRPQSFDLLLQARQNRPRPGLDDKCLCAWNGLMIGALAQHGKTGLAERCAQIWMSHPVENLPHQIVDQTPSGHAFLDDYAFLAQGLLNLHDATQNPAYKQYAEQIADHLLENFADPKKGGFFYSGPHHETLFGQTKPAMDNATPSPNGVAIELLRRLGRTQQALDHLTAVIGWAQRLPQSAGTILLNSLCLLLEAGEKDIPTPQTNHDIQVRLTPQELTVTSDGYAYADLIITIPENHHINSHEPSANWLVPTTIQLEGVYGEAGFIDSPTGDYQGETTLPVRLRPKSGTSEFQLTLTYQLCSETECYEPRTKTFEGTLHAPK